VRHVPVVAGGTLLGVVSARDLARAQASPATSLARHELPHLLEELPVGEIMARPVIAVEPAHALDDAVRIMVTEGVRALPVIEAGRLVGILTDTAVLDLFVTAMRAAAPATRLDLELGDGGGHLSEVLRTLEQAQAPIANILTLPTRHGRHRALIHIRTIDPRPAITALMARGYTVAHEWGDAPDSPRASDAPGPEPSWPDRPSGPAARAGTSRDKAPLSPIGT
jgi:acetoin utilization protein AcuB